MSTVITASSDARDPQRQAIVTACFALCVANGAALAAMYAIGAFLVGGDGRIIPTDFVNVWAAGRMALDGAAAAAYDPWLHKPVEDAALGWRFSGHYGWHYPPPFFFAATALALLPYLTAHALWVGATLPLYAAAVRAIVGDRLGWMLALGFPAALANVTVGQNGFLTAALIGGALHWMRARPILAGVCLGLLTYKPHFGLLFPLVLLADRRWSAFAAASVSAIALAALSWAAFGGAAWHAFFHWLPETSRAFLSEGQAEWAKLQSLFALVRVLGGGETLAWTVQIGLAAAATLSVVLLWRSAARFELKAAALAVGTLLVTPYVYLYDMVVLAIPVAYLIALGLRCGFARYELAALGAAAGYVLAFPFVMLPVGFAASLIVATLIAVRWRRERAAGRGRTRAGCNQSS